MILQGLQKQDLHLLPNYLDLYIVALYGSGFLRNAGLQDLGMVGLNPTGRFGLQGGDFRGVGLTGFGV